MRSRLREVRLKRYLMERRGVVKNDACGVEPTRAEPTGLAGRRPNHSAKASLEAISSHACGVVDSTLLPRVASV
jgi:hypothetical protein